MLFRILVLLSVIFAILTAGLWMAGQAGLVGPTAILAWTSLAIALQLKSPLRSFAFTVWVLASVTAAMFYPAAFERWGTLQLSVLIVPLIQVIMFGMGTTLSLADFSRVLSVPKAVLIGLVLQFSVMPLVGASIALFFGFEPAVAAGVVLIGSCPGGVASNVMTYLARGNVALSVTMTACSTLVSPVMTPLMMVLLAGTMLKIEFVPMMMSILNMIILPILAGLVANKILRSLNLRGPWLDKLLSFVAMAAICFIIAIITSLSRDKLLGVGLALIAAAVLHNGLGYIFGYTGARLLRCDESTCRTVAIEVGLQNGGMASGLAVNVLGNSDTALAAAIFGPWMNVSGSVLASWWRSKPIDSPAAEPTADTGAEDLLAE